MSEARLELVLLVELMRVVADEENDFRADVRTGSRYEVGGPIAGTLTVGEPNRVKH